MFKNFIKKIGICSLVLLLANPIPSYADDTTNSFSFVDRNSIIIDGNYDDWNDYPESYEYNWDNSQNCWNYGVWYNGVCYKTAEGTYDTNVRHKMQLSCDGKNVYLHIVFSKDYYSKFNGEDYQFSVDGKTAAFQVEYKGGGTITGNTSQMSVGTQEVEVRHRDSSMSYAVVNGSKAYLTKKADDVNMELELSVPLEQMELQNPSINTEQFSVIDFFTPNLMYRKITCAGTPTGTFLLCMVAYIIAFSSVFLFTIFLKSKNGKNAEKGSV